MIDVHYDLLSIAYVCYLKNDCAYLKQVATYFHKHNVKGLIANLYFMSEEEMKEELHPKYYQKDVSVLQMFQKAKEILDTFLPHINILYSIEGPDFIQGTDELEQLYQAGLHAISVSWNTKSIYASGNRSNAGLTTKGKELFQKAISLGMGIDLSHANQQTFGDMIDLIKKEQKKGTLVCCYASHSNSRKLCDRSRNLSDEQLVQLAEVGGSIGVFSNRNFIVPPNRQTIASKQEQEDDFLLHVDHIISIVGKDRIMIATDDMDFCKEANQEYEKVQIYNYATVCYELKTNLQRKYNDDTVYKILYQNAKENIFMKLQDKRQNK